MIIKLKRYKSSSKKEMQYSIDKLIEKYKDLDKRVAEMERASRKETGSRERIVNKSQQRDCKNTKIDTEFNNIVYSEILPSISKAFCSLAQSCNANTLTDRYSEIALKILSQKACRLKGILSSYIDRQVNCLEKLNGTTEKNI